MAYHNFDQDEMILRDWLALDRTILANERTLLAYIRTSIALLATGGVIIKIFGVNIWLSIIGLLLILAATGTLFLGIIRFKNLARNLRHIHVKKPADVTEQ